MSALLPGATLGVLGTGQLGRMLVIAAKRLGYRTAVFGPGTDAPAAQVADVAIEGRFDDLYAIRAFVETVDVVTFEFENVLHGTAKACEASLPVRPAGFVLHTTQHRLREKTWLSSHGFPVADFRSVTSADDARSADAALGGDIILKTASWGYDGKGQTRTQGPEAAAQGFADLGQQPLIAERVVPFTHELSVVVVRGIDGVMVDYGVMENHNQGSVLDLSFSPGRFSPEITERACALARDIARAFDFVGTLCVEMFLEASGELRVNELAPRPHNSGHLTVDAAVTCQFENQARAVLGLPLGDPTLRQPAAMANLLGDLWSQGTPRWVEAMATAPNVKLHLYGKGSPRRGRKMGHITASAPTLAEAINDVTRFRDALRPRG